MNHTFRGALSAWMVLIVLRTVGTSGGSGRIASAFNDVNKLTQRALSADVPAIPDRRAGAAPARPAGGLLADTFSQYSTNRVPTTGRSVPQ